MKIEMMAESLIAGNRVVNLWNSNSRLKKTVFFESIFSPINEDWKMVPEFKSFICTFCGKCIRVLGNLVLIFHVIMVLSEYCSIDSSVHKKVLSSIIAPILIVFWAFTLNTAKKQKKKISVYLWIAIDKMFAQNLAPNS